MRTNPVAEGIWCPTWLDLLLAAGTIFVLVTVWFRVVPKWGVIRWLLPNIGASYALCLPGRTNRVFGSYEVA
jgi:hypothetical protein